MPQLDKGAVMAKIFLEIGSEWEYGQPDPVTVRRERLIPDTHETLFNFLDADFSRLTLYAMSYLECIEKGIPADPKKHQRLTEELYTIHPFFSVCPSNAEDYLNKVFARYLGDLLSQQGEDEIRAAIRKVQTINHHDGVDLNHWFDSYRYIQPGDSLFQDLEDLQRNMSYWIFMVLDQSAPDLARLTANQRSSAYNMIFGDRYVPLLDLNMNMGYYASKALGQRSAVLDFTENAWSTLFCDIDSLQRNPGMKTPESLAEILTAAATISEDCEYHTYVISSLEDLLKYEVYEMSKEDVKVKRCKNCNRYFVLEKGNLEYCDRIAAGETKPCSEIGKDRTYQAKITGGNSPMALYRKAYKTHFARIRTGLMTKEQFEDWKAEALIKRSQAESGLIETQDYAAWLKI
jgi:hypothetical protein